MHEFDIFRKNTFVPLDVDQKNFSFFDDILDNKKIFIWGAGHSGKTIYRLLSKMGYVNKIGGFTDSNPLLIGKVILDSKVFNSEYIISLCIEKKAIIIIATANHSNAIIDRLVDVGLVNQIDFISYRNIPRPEAVIQLVKNNLYSFGSEQNILDTKNIIDYSDYVKILNKILDDLPYLYHIDFSGFCEPLLNPHLAEIVSYTETKVPCTITTSLSCSLDNIHKVLRSRPSQFVIIATGYEQSYEVNNYPKKWSHFKENLEIVCKLKEEYENTTEFRVNYQIYNNNNNACLESMKSLCKNLQIKIVESTGYVNRYDDILNLFQGLNVSPKGQKEFGILQWDLFNAMNYSSLDRLNPCLCQRIFPVINYDKSVGYCHLFTDPVVHHNILDADYKSVIKKDQALISADNANPLRYTDWMLMYFVKDTAMY